MSNASQFFSGGGATVWVSGRTYTIGNVVLSPADNYQQYVRITNGAGTTDPASDTTNYRPYGGRAIKSIQRGTVAFGANSSMTATISAVNTSKAEIAYLGFSMSGNIAEEVNIYPRLTLTNSTTITANRNGANTTNPTVSWQVTEYY